MRQRFENSGTFLNEATRLLTLLVALQAADYGSGVGLVNDATAYCSWTRLSLELRHLIMGY